MPNTEKVNHTQSKQKIPELGLQNYPASPGAFLVCGKVLLYPGPVKRPEKNEGTPG